MAHKHDQGFQVEEEKLTKKRYCSRLSKVSYYTYKRRSASADCSFILKTVVNSRLLFYFYFLIFIFIFIFIFYLYFYFYFYFISSGVFCKKSVNFCAVQSSLPDILGAVNI